jgi:formylglycine-generating enzyme required for sulfatase activity
VKLIFSRNKDLRIFLQGQRVIIPVSLDLIKALSIPRETMKRQSTPSTWLFLTCLFFSQAEMIGLFSQTPKPNRATVSSAIETTPLAKRKDNGASKVFTLMDDEAIGVRFMGNNPSHFKGSQLPVEKVSWDEAKAFCEQLTEYERTAGRLPQDRAYQLPTEAQWEYACRAGTKTAWNFGDSPSGLSTYANFSDKNSNLQGADKEYDDGFEFTAPVASYSANAWGFHEMHGNVFEWCMDWYGKHTPVAVIDPVGPLIGKERIFRGGSWALPGVFTRSARRDKNQPILKSGFLGFRLCLGQVQDKE